MKNTFCLPGARFALFAVTTICAAALVLSPAALAAENEQELIKTLTSQGSKDEKAIACKKLTIYGSANAVPALAPLLLDEQLTSWARTALEAIPGPAADEALRNALPKANGRVLIGIINSIAVRKDAKGIEPLTGLLKNGQPEVAAAAAVALGHIGGDKAAKALRPLLTKGPEPVRGGAAEGCILCAEKYVSQGKQSAAVKLYDDVRKVELPKQKLLDATRGAILARGSKGIPLLVESLRSPDKAMFALALTVARELPGADATQAVAKEMNRAAEQRQPLILLALADRTDASAMPVIENAARTGSKNLRLAAISVLERAPNASVVPLLLEVATGSDTDLAQASKASLARLQGSDVDADLLRRLSSSTGKTRQAIIEVASRRSIESAVPEFMKSAASGDEGVRSASLQAIGALGGSPQVPDLVRLLKQTSKESELIQLEQALLAICGRVGSGCVPEVLGLSREGSSAVKIVAVRALAAAGGPESLNAVKAATKDSDTSVQDEAVRTLSSWPNTWPEDSAIAEALMDVAKNDGNLTHKVLAMRGYIQFLQGDRKLSLAEKVGKVDAALPLMQRAEEKRSAVALVQKIQDPAALELLAKLAADESVRSDACSALLDLAGKDRKGITRDQRRQALEIVAKSSSEDTEKRKAEELVKSLQ